MINYKKQTVKRTLSVRIMLSIGFALTLLLFTGGAARNAEACCSCCLFTDHMNEHQDTISTIQDATADAIEAMVNFLYADSPNTFWESMVLPQLRIMTLELSSLITNFPAAFGGMLDGESMQYATQRLESIQGEIARKQIPAVSMCQYATLSKSLEASEVAREETTRVFAMIGTKRHSLNSDFVGADAPTDDITARYNQFRSKYCMSIAGSVDFGGLLEGVCGGVANPDTAGSGPDTVGDGAVDSTVHTSVRKKNRDLDFAQMLGLPKTLNVAIFPGYGPGESRSQIEDIVALGKNLYGTNATIRFPVENLKASNDDQDLERFKLLKLRALQAKRNAAYHSYANYIGMKSATDKADGTELAAKASVENLLIALGIDNSADKGPNDYFNKLGLGLNESSPSYWAQMDILTKKIYQNPSFFVNLYDNPSNVKRQQAALESIELMQERDIHETALRTEMLLSLWLDEEVESYGEDIVENWSTMKAPKK